VATFNSLTPALQHRVVESTDLAAAHPILLLPLKDSRNRRCAAEKAATFSCRHINQVPSKKLEIKGFSDEI